MAPLAVKDKSYTLADFLLDEMKRRDMSMREFAAFVDIDHTTISKHLSGKGGIPSDKVLVKLSEKTGIDFLTLFAIAHPDLASKLVKHNPRVLYLAERLERLPKAVQDFILSSISNSQ